MRDAMRAIGRWFVMVAFMFTLLNLLSLGLLFCLTMILQWLLGRTPFQLGGVEVLLGAILLYLLCEGVSRAERADAEFENTPEFRAGLRRSELFADYLRTQARKKTDETQDGS